MRDEYEKSMTAEDLQYLIDNSDKENAIKHYQELLDKIQGGQEPSGTLRFKKEETETTEGDGGEQTVTESVQEGQEQPQDGGGEDAPPTGEKPPEGQESATGAKPEGDGGGEEGGQTDEKYDTALSVALNYLQDEKKNK